MSNNDPTNFISSRGRIKVDDKRIINCRADLNQVLPIKYEWAWQKYRDACNNHWTPQEIIMNADIAKWKSNDLTEEDRIIIKRSLGYFSTADSLVANNIVLTLYKFITNPECFVEGTEVLLSDGTWKEIKLVNIETDLVAQFDTDTEEISFVKPLKKIRKTINEKVINFGNKKGNVELCVTKNHDLVVKSKINKTIKKIQAKDLKPSTVYYHLCAGRVSDTKIPFGPLDQLKLAFQADGSFPSSYNNGNRSGFVNLQFKIKKERKIERLENICKELNFSLNKIFNEKRQAYNIYIKVPQNILFSKNLNDMFNFSEIDSERGKSIINELRYWDGRINNNVIGYSTTNKNNADFLQSIASISNTMCKVTKIIDPRPDHVNDKPIYELYFQLNKNTIQTNTFIIDEKQYTGSVHCLTMPKGTLIVRYNNKVSISGNCRQFLLRQAFEEALHTESYIYCIESLSLDEGEIFNMYHEVPSVANKAEWSIQFTESLSDPNLTTTTEEGAKKFLRNLISFFCVMEGIFFYCGFAQILSMGRRQIMTGVSEQFQYILRDESNHLNFGIDVINQIKIENPHLWDSEMQNDAINIIKQGTELEIAYARDTMKKGTLGMNARVMEDYLKFIANRRLNQIGLPEQYPNTKNPFPWMSEVIDLKKEKNFFETKVTEYKNSGALQW